MAKDVTSPSFTLSLLVFVKEAKMALSRLQASLIAHQKCVKQWSSKNRMEQEQRGTDWVCWKEGIGGGRSLGAAETGKKAPPLAPWLTQTHFLVFHYHLALPILLLPSVCDGDDSAS